MSWLLQALVTSVAVVVLHVLAIYCLWRAVKHRVKTRINLMQKEQACEDAGLHCKAAD